MSDFINISNLTFSYPSSTELLFDSISFQLHKGWTGIVGANGSGKSTLLKLICGLVKPNSGSISGSGSFYYCEQATDNIPAGLKEFLESYDSSSFRLKEILQIQDDWLTRWNTLSHGERKRCQIAAALYIDSDILAVDEPSNHLDYNSKQILFEALKLYKGVGLLVSHDRKLLDELCRHTMFIFPQSIEVYKCSYSTAHLELERSNSIKINEYESVKKEIKKLKKKAVVQKTKADKADRLRSKRDIAPKDFDAKAKIDFARLTGKDGIAGQQYKKIRTQLERKIDYSQTIEFRREASLGIEFNTQKTNKYFPLHINSFTLSLCKSKILHVPDLRIDNYARIGITGDNGSGKSTFINHFVNNLNWSKDEFIFIPQEIEVDEIHSLISHINSLKDAEKGKVMTIISKLNSDPKHVLETKNPSPGEVRKLLLALGIMKSPGMIIMDEPTNHMDIPSIECLENALSECKCALLLVSHDITFLNNLVSVFWRFERREKDFFILQT